ncbi:hypothetical protein CDD80_2561 [Ophiocordyceps camponoti-rufipedis]|uniref:Fido domain-containing protein n=1 Tax=Ophiocordyceps camponoti-rufipedis TaxID=2004952 RepID=A0A2C5ZK66_9HYPO|nr:hypothetical protein CDD80_2561 [Ophiocordyceps camponoti-rufipedis]
MTIHADDVYRNYGKDENPKQLFEKASQWMRTMRRLDYGPPQYDIIDQEIHEAIVRAIYGSNAIEGAGLDLDTTVQLCRKLLRGEDLGEIPDTTPSYMYQEALVEHYRRKHPVLRSESAQYILRGRNEVIQHVRAYQHIIHAFVTEKKDMSEDLIKDTHRILTEGVPIISKDHEDVPPEMYGGLYRTVIVGAGSTNFTVPKFVPTKMKELCDNLKSELAAAADNNAIDPFSVASKYSLQFVEIHPFQDGNGRMCRMILNAILCRYAGVIVPIGEREEERVEYLDIKKRASRDMEGHGEYATFVLKRAATRIRELKKKLSGKRSL